MNLAYNNQLVLDKDKRSKITEFLANSYWGKDVWCLRDDIFDLYKAHWKNKKTIWIKFNVFPTALQDEIKYFFAQKILSRAIVAETIFSNYKAAMKRLGNFLNEHYPYLTSFSDVHFEKVISEWESYVTSCGTNIHKNNIYKAQLYQPYLFYSDFYNSKDEFEKDIWDCRKIPFAKYALNDASLILNFTHSPPVFKEMLKRFVKLRLTIRSLVKCRQELCSVSTFLADIHRQEPQWTSLNDLSRRHVENFLISYKNSVDKWGAYHSSRLCSIRNFLDFIQRAEYSEAPQKSSATLFFYEDIPSIPFGTKLPENIKYIPENVISQLEDNLGFITPCEYIPIIFLFLISGWRSSDILNLRYDKCLEKTEQGWYLCGDILKTGVLNHHIPITDEAYTLLKATCDEIKAKSTDENNPLHLLFNRFRGKRISKCPTTGNVALALNNLAKSRNITDDQGNIYHFKLHAFRHTKGVELINNGMSLIHVQKWLAHVSPEMTMVYAKVLDTTMRKSWEEATKKGLFRIDEYGKVKQIDISEIQNEDLIEWEYIRHNLDAVRMPLGFCMKPKKQECHSQLNPCLTCRNLCTTPDFIPQYEMEMRETRLLIERGRSQGRDVWVDKNQCLLSRYEEIITFLKAGKTHHLAGKKGREYTGEERSNVNT